MKEQMLSVGDLAQLSGLTIRTLQYYDRINLLPASGKTESGRRFYTKLDSGLTWQMMLSGKAHNGWMHFCKWIKTEKAGRKASVW